MPPTQSGGATPPPAPSVVYGRAPSSPPPPPPPVLSEQTLYVLLAVAGGVLLVGFLMAAIGVDPGVSVPIAFLGLVMLVIVLIVGAAGATEISREGRVAMGVLAGLLVLFGIWTFAFFAAASTAPAVTCGAIAAAPALFALRLFSLFRDGYLAKHPSAA